MSAVMAWSIAWMQSKPIEGNLTDVVVFAKWVCTGVENAGGRDYTQESFGVSEFQAPSETFTPYANLTEQQVLGWCWADGVNKEEVEAQVQASLTQTINEATNPPIIELPLPWAQA